MTETAPVRGLPFEVTNRKARRRSSVMYTSYPLETAPVRGLPLYVTPGGTNSTSGETSSSVPASGALSSWTQAGLRFAASDQAVIEARARILDSHSATSPSRNRDACGAYHA